MTRYIVMMPIFLCLMLGTASAVEENRNDRGIDDTKRDIDGLKERVDEMSGLGISGFFDVNASNYENNPNAFALGDFEFNWSSIEQIVLLELFWIKFSNY